MAKTADLSLTPEKEKKVVHEKEWSNPIEFLMTCIGFSVGLGNVWR
jgi:SNF family Na+-dependent transporter